MAKLILLRHFKSQWNLENRFTGWVDVPLAKDGDRKAKSIAKKIIRSFILLKVNKIRIIKLKNAFNLGIFSFI